MTTVTTIKEAEQFFLKNSSKHVIAINSEGERKLCECYPEAEEHINKNQ